MELTQPFLVEFESGPTDCETSHEDVDVDLHGNFVLEVSVDHLDHFVVHDAKGLKFLSVVFNKLYSRSGDEMASTWLLLPC